MPRHVLVVAALVAALGAGACGTSDGDPAPSPTTPTPTASPSPTGTAAAPSQSPSPSPSPTYPDDGVLPDNTGDDPTQAIRAIIEFRHHLFEVPNPDKVGLIYAQVCSCYEALREDVLLFADGGFTMEAPAPRVTDVRIQGRNASLATVRYTVQSQPGVVRNPEGEVTERRTEAGSQQRLEAEILRQGSRWRVQTIRQVES